MNWKRLQELVALAVELERPSRLDFGEYYSPYYSLMNLLAFEMAPCVAVELGVEKGRGAISLCEGASSCRVFGIDTQDREELAVVEKWYPNFTFILSPSTLWGIPEKIPLQIDILHIDTEHSYSMAKAEFELYSPRLRDGGVVLFDDLHAAEDDVQRYFDELPYDKIADDRLHAVVGYGVLVYKKEKDNGNAL